MRGHTVRSCPNPSRPSPATATRLARRRPAQQPATTTSSWPPRPTTWAGWWAPCRRWPRSSGHRRPAPRTHPHRLARLRRPGAFPRTHDRPRRRLRPVGLRPRAPSAGPKASSASSSAPAAATSRSPAKPSRSPSSKNSSTPWAPARPQVVAAHHRKARHLRLPPGLARPATPPRPPACGSPATTRLPYPRHSRSAIQSGTTAARGILKPAAATP